MKKEDIKAIYRKIIVVIVTITVIGIISILRDGEIYNKNNRYMLYMILIMDILMLSVPIFIWFLFKVIQKIKKKEYEVVSEDYYREIENSYTPAMASFMVDNNIEAKEAILATVLDLSVKGYLKVEKDFATYEIIVVKNDMGELYSHEQYVMECIIKHELINQNYFKDCIIKDCEDRNLIIENPEKKAMVLFCVLSYISIVVIGIVGIMGCILGIFINILMRKYVHTEEGKEFALKVKQLKNFIKDYTLLKERNIEDITLFDRYIPYAIALGEADNIENKYIKYKDWQDKYIE